MKAPKSKPKQENSSFKVEIVEKIKDSDILCGKDKSCVAHAGSVRFRKMIDEYRERYCSDTTSKQERMAITKEIVRKLSKSSRFIKYDNKERVWKTISALAARDKVSHALRFANLKENRRTGKVKGIKRRSSNASSGQNAKPTTPEDAELWKSLVTRQSKLLESIKKGEKDQIPDIVELELSEDITTTSFTSMPALTPSIVEDIDCDPLSIDDSSHENNPTFQDYCLHLYDRAKESHEESEDDAGEQIDSKDPVDTEGSGDNCCASVVSHRSEKCLYEDQNECDASFDGTSNSVSSEDDQGDEIASMIAEPLMEWDLEHDGIFEV